MEKSGKPSPSDDRPRELQETDYEHWGAADLWTLSEAAALLMGWEPVTDEEIPLGPARDRFNVVREKLKRDTGKTTTNFQYTMEHGHRYYPWVVIEWAESSPVSFPGKLKTAVFDAWPSHIRTRAHITERNLLKQQIVELKSELAKTSREAQPLYMKSDHEFFAPELEAAVSVWVALYESGRLKLNVGHKPQSKEWLRQNYDGRTTGHEKLTTRAIERITIVVNPNKRGGAPSTNRRKT